MRKKYAPVHLKLFGVYYTFMVLGQWMRSLSAAFPTKAEAEKWIADKCEINPILSKTSHYMIEEVPAMMKAWDGNCKNLD